MWSPSGSLPSGVWTAAGIEEYLGAKFTLISVGFAYACQQEGPACALHDPVPLPCLHWWLDLEACRNHSFITAANVDDVVVVTPCSSVQAPLVLLY